MNKEEFLTAITFLNTAYNKEATQEQLSVWYEFFKDTDNETFKKAIKRVITKERFMPSISVIKSEIAELTNPNLKLNADDEWEYVIEAIRSCGDYHTEKALNSLKSYTRKIVMTMGWSKLCRSTIEELVWLKKSFKDLFEAKQHNDFEVEAINENALTVQELMQLAEQHMKEEK